MARSVARRTLLAPLDDVWAFLVEPFNLADWWPGISGVEPDRRGLAPGARWRIVGPNTPSYFRRPQSSGTLLVLDVVPKEKLAFQLTGDRIDAELSLRALDERRTDASLIVDGPFLIGLRRRYPAQALDRLYSLVQTGDEV
jgi:uncharacterized protein YndB with AHSA1/START domain